ncbi:MAG: Fe-S cluster assembly protein SufD, partial [Opitutaceae bacterium]|nr:Fe-S cluster assembly protein SufD [Opitutaceae bacterium]
IIFTNHQPNTRSPLPPELAERGVIFCTLDEALRNHADIVHRYFRKHPANPGGEKFVALNTAYTTTGALLYVPKGIEIAAPLILRHTLDGDNKALFPHTLVILEDQAHATLVEYFSSATPHARQLASGVNHLHAGPGAHLTYIGAQTWSDNTLAYQSTTIEAGRDAHVLTLNLHLGGHRARHESHSRLHGPGAHTEMLALTIADGAREYDQRTRQTHAAPHTTSNLLYKNALLDTARTIFSGLITVEPDAQKTDAYQSNRNLMLSDTAEANSLPGLEIEANDVRCTHGSTTSRIEPEQQFYLQARGIDQKNAHELLIYGFFEEVLGKLENEPLHDALVALIRGKFKK